MESWAGPGYEAVKYLWILVDEFNNSILVAVGSFNILYFEFCWDLALKTWLKGTFYPFHGDLQLQPHPLSNELH